METLSEGEPDEETISTIVTCGWHIRGSNSVQNNKFTACRKKVLKRRPGYVETNKRSIALEGLFMMLQKMLLRRE